MGVRPRTALAVTLGVFAAAGVVALVLVAASLGGPQFPSEEDLPELPMGYSYAEPARGCGSGGCFVEAEVVAPEGLTPTEALAELDVAVAGCRAHGLLDRRSRCTGVAVLGRDMLTVSVQLRDFGK